MTGSVRTSTSPARTDRPLPGRTRPGLNTGARPIAAGPVLASRSHHAQLIVVGDRGHGGFVGLLIGSVSQQLIFHAACPVAVVRDDQEES